MKVNLTEKEFIAYSDKYDIVPLYGTIETGRMSSLDLYTRITGGKNNSFILESDGEKGQYSFIGFDPARIFKSGEDNQDILDEVKDYLAPSRAPIEGLPPFSGGVVGYIGYEMVGKWQNLFHSSKREMEPSKHNGAVLMAFNHVIAKQEGLNKTQIIENIVIDRTSDLSRQYGEALKRLETTENKIRSNAKQDSPERNIYLSEVKPKMDRVDFMELVEKGKDHIVKGDICQVVLSQRFEAKTNIPSLTIYEALKEMNPSPYMFYVKHPNLELIGSSPEVLVKNQDSRAVTRPLAGTRRRGNTKEEDSLLREDLMSDQKELAEHLMLVDLARNDLGRVCKTGSVEVTELMEVENYSQVMHIVSQVEGDVRDDRDSFDLLRSSFPAGTLSGAPKIRAMEIIEELEPVPRGPYGGAVGYIDYDGNMDTCIAIRTFIREGETLSVQSGAGIVYDSQPELEYKETQNKAKALFKALERAKEMTR